MVAIPMRAASLPGVLDPLSGEGAPVINAAFGDNLVTGLFGDHHYVEDMRYRYSAELADPWQTEIGVAGTLIADLGVHFDAEVARTRIFELEHGIIRGGRVFPLQTTPGANGVPSNSQSILDIQADWVVAAVPWLEDLSDTFTWIFGLALRDLGGSPSSDLIQATTSTGAADLLVPLGTFPAGTVMTIDSWADDAVLTDGRM